MKKSDIKYSKELLIFLKKKRVLTAFIKNAEESKTDLSIIYISSAFYWGSTKEGHIFWKGLCAAHAVTAPIITKLVTIKEFRSGK